MPRLSRPESAGRSFLHLLWLQPLVAIPFALFFGTMQGATRSAYVGSYLAALFFAYPIAISIWALEHFVIARVMPERDDGGGRTMPLRIGLYAVASLIGAAIGGLALNRTIAPGFMGNAREWVMTGMFTLLFMALFMGVATARLYYKKALDRAGTERELQLARRIQRSFLISDFPRRPRVEVHAVNVSSKEVSGDFYDVVPAGDDGLLFVIADVSGKGVPAALLSSMLQGLVRVQAGALPSPAAAMRLLNTLACQREATGQFATLFLAAIHEPTMTLRYTNAGHNPPVLVRRGEKRLLETGGLLLGIAPAAIYEEGVLTLEPGDRLVLYTDGVTEAANARGEMVGEERFYGWLAEMDGTLDSKGVVENVLDRVRGFLGDTEAGDDITVMALRVLEDGVPHARRLEGGAARST
jgi:serine phosphatase RsbU (regulator of sigma subunit)